MADRQLAGAPAPDSAAALNGAGADVQHHSTRPTAPEADASSPPPTAVDNRPSQYVPDPSRPQSQVVEDHPMAEKQSKSTYALHFPSLCHDSSISPLPPPMTHTAGRYITPVVADTAPKTKTSRMKKWYKTRIFLHVVHWIIFILVNIPGFVNVALVPLWYNPPPIPHEEGGGTNRGVNSPHRLAGLCDWSPDVIWAGTARPPAYPPPCAQTVPYRAWLWGAIGRVLITFFISVLWVIMDGIWWGSWVVGTRNIGWRGAVGRPWHRRRVPAPKPVVEEEEEEGDLDSDGDRRHEIRESALARRIRLLSVTSKASGKSGRSGSNKEKLSENEGKHPMPRREAIKSTHSITSVGLSAAAAAPAATEHTNGSNSQHKVRRKPVRTISPSSPLAEHASLSETSPPTTSYGSPMDKSYFEQVRPMGGLGSRRPSAHESIGGSTVVGSPPGPTFLPASPTFFPTSPPMSSAQLGVDDRGAQPSRRSIGLDIVPEDSNSSPEQEGEIRYPERPPSRLARYDDNGIYGQRPSDSPEFPMYHPSMTGPGWAADPSMSSPVASPGTQAPLLGRNYFMVGDGGFLAGNPSEGAYDEDSYYRAMSGGVVDYPVIHQDRQRATSPHSERSSSPTSYGHGNLAGVDLRVETPTDDDEIDGNHQYPAQTAWYPIPSLLSASQQAMPYQHPLAQGIQIAMGRPIEPMEREVRMLGGVIRRMSTIESFGSHERELSRRGSGATARTTQTGRGNSAGTAAREGTNGSSNSGGHQPTPLTQGSTGNNASGSGGQVDRSTEDDHISGIVRASSPVEMTNPEK
ncbi:hypothetical protein CPB86DRAFT_783469 [Serendipita vermifera]|nr:hypothetical protein CPB86DRAFT_783469 [Serendipita vermifera]